ncbi:MAG: STAS domain-containing protein [Chitinispirillaceae bacterium]|nr:STAS domain-containing protein [Chitinispirillaceae bacterium]
MVVTESALHSWRIITLRGKFLVRNIATIRPYFEQAEKEPLPKVAIDMSGVSQLDSSAVTILVNFQRRIVQKDGLLVLFGMPNDIAEIFSIVGIDKMFRICSGRRDFEALYGTTEK